VVILKPGPPRGSIGEMQVLVRLLHAIPFMPLLSGQLRAPSAKRSAPEIPLALLSSLLNPAFVPPAIAARSPYSRRCRIATDPILFSFLLLLFPGSLVP
jgi:hypothetical protein